MTTEEAERAIARARADAAEAEVASLRAVAVKIMAATDLEAALSSVTREALAALEADIAGVFLRSGVDEIVRRGCAGMRSRDTARLRMQRHQGLAGLVFDSGQAARVDQYVRSESISAHFHDLTQARHRQVDLRTELCVLVGELTGLAEVGKAEGWDSVRVDGVRRRLVAVCREELARAARLSLVGSSGDSVVVLAGATSEGSMRASLTRLAGLLAAQVPGLRPVWGVSAPRTDAMEPADAYAEAQTAARALRHVPDRTVSCYSELGILRLMLADGRSTDLSRFVRETVGPVLDYDRATGRRCWRPCAPTWSPVARDSWPQGGCSSTWKTVKYRLVQVEKLTGLDLAAHHDRLRVDTAVRAAELFGAGS